MKVRFTNLTYRRRFGLEKDLPDDMARKLIGQGIAEAVVNPKPGAAAVAKKCADRPGKQPDPQPRPQKKEKPKQEEKSIDAPVRDKMIKAPPVHKGFRTRYMKVAWVQDDPRRPWGAEASNDVVIRVGRDLGFEIIKVTPANMVDILILEAADMVVLNNLFQFGEHQFTMLLDVIFSGKPYIRYEHDYGFCSYRGCQYCRGQYGTGDHEKCASCETNLTPQSFRHVDIYRRLLSRSALNVFLSPLHAQVHANAFGKAIEPYFILTPPVDTRMFFIDPEVHREPNLVVAAAGKYVGDGDKKGWKNVRKWIENNPRYRYEIYSAISPAMLAWKSGNHSQVKLLDSLPLREMPQVFQRATKCLALPNWPEPAGRTAVEAALCGCEPVMNENMGVASFATETLSFDDPLQLKAQIDRGPYQFWKAVEAVI